MKKFIIAAAATALTSSLLVIGSAGATQASTIPACYGEFKPGVECRTGVHPTGEFYGTALGCDNAGRAYVQNVRVETAQGTTVGWYTWECDNLDGQWMLTLRGMVEK